MFIRKRGLTYFFLLTLFFIILFSINVPAESVWFKWFDAGGVLCHSSDAGETNAPDTGLETLTYYASAPFSILKCCDTEGTVTVEFCTYTGCYPTKINAYSVNWDTDSVDCACYGKTWGLSGDYSSPLCCGDDASEYKTTRNCASWCSSSTSDVACCNSASDCVYNGACYNSGSCYQSVAICNSGTWSACPAGQTCVNGHCVPPTCLISASPNPCTIPADGSLCTSTISWTAANTGGVDIKVDTSLFASTGDGSYSQNAPWISAADTVFKCVQKSTGNLLGSVTVKGVCTNECSPSGARQCSSSTAYQTCGNYDADSCLEWGSATSCPSGQTCVNGQCVVANEVCTAPGDENNNGECDYDSSTCSHGDSACPVGVTAISVSNPSPPRGSNIDVDCTSTVAGVNSIIASIDGIGGCSWQSWNGNVAKFSCNVGLTIGSKTVRCSVDTSKSYKSGSDQTTTVNVVASICSGYITPASCDADSRCDWCTQCVGVKYTGGLNRCVDTGSCSPYCWKDQCGATCDPTNGGCTYSTCDTTTCSCKPYYHCNRCSTWKLYCRVDFYTEDSTCYSVVPPTNPVTSTCDCSCTGWGNYTAYDTSWDPNCIATCCTNDCSSSGARQCSGSTAYQTCGNYDADSCLEWGNATRCPSGQTCSNEQCVPPTCLISASPNPCSIPAGSSLCTSTISWTAADTADGVDIKVDESTFAYTGNGVYNKDAPWIGVSDAVFNCVDHSIGNVLGSVTVKGVYAGEVCTIPGDENNNSECDYDSSVCSHGDSACPVGVTAINVSNPSPPAGSSITVDCTSTKAGVNSISASVDGASCTWQSWNGNVAKFSCNVGSTGSKTVKCFVDTSKSYAISGQESRTATINVLASNCPDYTTQTPCDADSNCDWCIECSGVKGVKYGGPNRCVNTGTCPNPYCWNGQCGAVCDLTNGGCTLPSTCNTTTCSCVCTPATCSDLGKSCGSWSDGCGGTLNCGSCPSGESCCNGRCVNEAGKCTDKADNDCDGKIDNLDSDCPGCPVGTTVCKDGTCSDDCDEPQDCIGSLNGTCDEGEGCACEECEGKRDSCATTLICDSYYGTCSCPVGTKSCPDGTCKESCGTCNGISLESGEECDGTKFSNGLDHCADIDKLYSGGILKCSNCKIDVSSCTQSTADTDDDGMPDWWEIQNGLNPNSNLDAVLNPDGDGLTNLEEYQKGTNPNNPDTDGDGLNDKEDPCPLDPSNPSNCDTSIRCGNDIVNFQETCDRTNLDGKTCSSFGFTDGELACFELGSVQQCHFDTSGCYNISINCNDDDGECNVAGGEDCTCNDCIGEQAKCGYGQVCDTAATCKCEDGTTLCGDACRTPAECGALPGCKTTGGTSGCDSEEGCDCTDCEGKTDTCKSSSTCIDGKCTACSLLKAYWTEDCIGAGIPKGVSIVVEGTAGCEGKTVSLQLWEDDGTFGSNDFVKDLSAVFKNGKAELKWTPEFPDELINEGCPICDAKKSSDNPPKSLLEYYFIAKIGKEEVRSADILKVHYCVYNCDKDCDTYVDNGLEDKCSTEINDPNLKYGTHKGEFRIDANPKSGYCEDCTPDGLSPGQETCAAYFDCTPDWSGVINPSLEWGECGEDKEATGLGRAKVTSDLMRNRLTCAPELPLDDCCKDKTNCYCEVPSQEIIDEYNCDTPAFRPTEIKACLLEEKFSFFTNMNILIVVLILIGFYIWKNREQEKSRTKR